MANSSVSEIDDVEPDDEEIVDHQIGTNMWNLFFNNFV